MRPLSPSIKVLSRAGRFAIHSSPKHGDSAHIDGPHELGPSRCRQCLPGPLMVPGSLPHPQRTHRLPKEMAPVEPAAFAAELISRLEKLKLELESRHSLEERLQQIREDEEKEGSEQVLSSRDGAPIQHPLALLPSGNYEEDPQTILDDHLSRVLKTPGCQSPGVGRYSPRSRSPDHHHHHHQQYHSPLPIGGKLPPVAACPLLGGKNFLTKQTTKHVHHHYIHHHAVPKTKEEIEAEATQRVRCLCPGGTEYYCYSKCKSHPKVPEPLPGEQFCGSRGSTLPKRNTKGTEQGLALPAREGGMSSGSGAPQLPGEEGDRSQDVWQWMLESERQSKSKPQSAQSLRKSYPLESARTSPGERVSRHHLLGANGHPRSVARAHPFTQDPAMPPLTPPNTLAQLEEACRRLAEVSKPPKQRCCVTSQQRDRNHSTPGQAGATPLSNLSLAPADHKEPKKLASVHVLQASELVVTYFFCGEEIPYRRVLKTQSLTLGHFKEQLSRKGNYRYYFKKASDEFACGAVFEEIWDDETVLPMYEGRILGKVERID